MTDAQLKLANLLVLVAKKDHEAFRSLYELTSSKLLDVCVRICGDRLVAEDMLHDVYLIVWQRADKFDPKLGSPVGWLVMIARNRSFDFLRSVARRPLQVGDTVVEISDPSPLADETIITSDEADRIIYYLSTLSVEQRSTLKSAYFDDVTYVEIARRAGIPVATVKSWARRGLAKLKSRIENERESVRPSRLS